MNKFFIFILCLCCALTVAQATGEDRLNDSDANVFGHVLDKKTGEHLPFINVLLKGTTIGTTTDNSGHYFLKNLPEGKFTLEYKALGYKTISKEVTLKKGKTLEINVELEEDQIALDGVVVSANRAETSRRLAPTLVNVLDVSVIYRPELIQLFSGMWMLLQGRILNHKMVKPYRTRKVKVLRAQNASVSLDGRILDRHFPLEITIQPEAITLIIPN